MREWGWNRNWRVRLVRVEPPLEELCLNIITDAGIIYLKAEGVLRAAVGMCEGRGDLKRIKPKLGFR